MSISSYYVYLSGPQQNPVQYTDVETEFKDLGHLLTFMYNHRQIYYKGNDS